MNKDKGETGFWTEFCSAKEEKWINTFEVIFNKSWGKTEGKTNF